MRGTEDEVLLETPLSGTLFTGYTRLYIPVVISVPGGVSGQIVRARLGRYDGERVRPSCAAWINRELCNKFGGKAFSPLWFYDKLTLDVQGHTRNSGCILRCSLVIFGC